MPEIRTPIIELEEGKTYTAKAGDFLITEKHSLSDVLRFLVDQVGVDDIRYLLNHDYE